jgi:flavin reductase
VQIILRSIGSDAEIDVNVAWVRSMQKNVNLYKLGMRRLAAGVSVVTTRDKTGVPHGMIATSVTSVCLTPPSLLTCINKTASSHDVFHARGFFCVNLLAEEATDIARRFSSSEFRELRFREEEWSSLETGSPVLKTSVASFDCKVMSVVDADSHTIFIGEVVAVSLAQGPVSPLIYLDGAFVRSTLLGGPT